jgi:orotate phosphoribosyltransferase-like protein
MNADFLEDKLKTLTAEQLADRLDISVNTLRWQIKELGIDVRQIKHDYALELLNSLSGKMKFTQMAKETGFGIRKIKNYAAKYGIQSLTGYK